MKTPSEYTILLKNKTISADMLADCLYSVNKRAKNARDRGREYRYSGYNTGADLMKYKYYAEKDFLLSLLEPVCIHKELLGYERRRIYDYEKDYRKYTGQYIWENCYYDEDKDDYVYFGDIELKDKPKYNYYLFYELAGHSFHHPVDADEISQWHNLRICDIDRLDTHGEDTCNLLSTQFVQKVMALIYNGDYTLNFADHKEPLPVFTDKPTFLTEPKQSRKPHEPISCPATKNTISFRGDELTPVDYIRALIRSRFCTVDKQSFIDFAKAHGMQIKSKTKECEAIDFIEEHNLADELLGQYDFHVTKKEYSEAGLSDEDYRYLVKTGRLKPIGTIVLHNGNTWNQYSLNQYLAWRTGKKTL